MLVCKNLSKKYHKNIFYNFNYQFNKGLIYLIIGSSGIGKSTLLKLIAKINKNYKGDIFYENINIKNIDDYLINYVSYVYQNNEILSNLTVLENIIIPDTLINKTPNLAKIKTLAKRFKIDNLLNKKVKDLSAGELQRVCIVRALNKDFKILLLDEPTSNLSHDLVVILLEYLNQIKKDKIIIMVSHNLDIISSVDEVIDFNNLNKNNTIDVKENKKIIKSKKININNKNINSIFKNKKIFDYFLTSILSIGLVGFLLANLLNNLIESVKEISLNVFDTSSYVTIKAKGNETEIDFKNLDILDNNYYYFEGIESSLKDNIKNNNKVDKITFNDIDTLDNVFIYDNYLNVSSNKLILLVPSYIYNDYLLLDNYLTIYVASKSFNIKIDEVYPNEIDKYEIFSNNLDYLNLLFNYLNINLKKSIYYYSEDIDNYYNYFISNKLYSNYYFIKYSDINLLSISKINDFRITNDLVLKLKDYKYILSDNKHTYIDFESGLIYLIEDDGLTQIIIDESISDDKINISKKYYSYIEKSNYLIIYDKKYDIEDINNESNYAIIYMNLKTFNNLNDSDFFVGIIFSKKITGLSDYFIINNNLIDSNNLEVFQYISDFIVVFSFAILILATLSFIYLFKISFNSKKAELKCLINLGINQKSIIKIMLYNPIKVYLVSLLSSLLTIILAKKIIELYYYNVYGNSLTLKLNYFIMLIIYLLPLLLISVFIVININTYYKKNDF